MGDVTIWDILEISPDGQPVDKFSRQDIEWFSKDCNRDDLLMLYLHFRDSLWLLSKRQYYLASILSILKVEWLLKENLLSKKDGGNWKEIENFTLPVMGRRILTESGSKIVDGLYEQRRELIHRNMEKYKQRQRKAGEDEKMKEGGDLVKQKPDPAWEHAFLISKFDTKIHFGGWKKIFRECIDVAKEIDAERLTNKDETYLRREVEFWKGWRLQYKKLAEESGQTPSR